MSKDLVLLWITQLKRLLTHCCHYFTILKVWTHCAIKNRGVPNCGFRLFGRIRIRITLPAEHFDAAPAVLIFTTSLCHSLIRAVPACCLAMTLSPSFVSHNQAVWARAAGTDWVKSAIDVTSCTMRTNQYSFWQHYSSECEYTNLHWSEHKVNIRYIHNCCSFVHKHWFYDTAFSGSWSDSLELDGKQPTLSKHQHRQLWSHAEGEVYLRATDHQFGLGLGFGLGMISNKHVINHMHVRVLRH